MNTRTKNVLGILLVAILSSAMTLFGYNVIVKKNFEKSIATANGGNTTSDNMLQFANTFGQDKGLTLTNLTTEDGYPDFTVAAEKSVHAVVHVKTKSIRQEQFISPFDFFFGLVILNIRDRENK